jgi:acyl-CoA reductase-like NAD-dependent aldehyde dehydrogenase
MMTEKQYNRVQRYIRKGMTTAQEEIFGPVLSVLSYTTEEEAIAIANNSTYGLAACVTTTNPEHGNEIAGQLEARGVMANGPFD